MKTIANGLQVEDEQLAEKVNESSVQLGLEGTLNTRNLGVLSASFV
jgi:hypothetical protein